MVVETWPIKVEESQRLHRNEMSMIQWIHCSNLPSTKHERREDNPIEALCHTPSLLLFFCLLGETVIKCGLSVDMLKCSGYPLLIIRTIKFEFRLRCTA